MMTCPDSITADQWDHLSPREREFLHEANEGGMRCLVLEDGRACAWGPAIDGLFSMEVKAEPNEFDGYVVTLP